MSLGYDFSFFLDFTKQIASRKEDHSTKGNLLCHLIGSPVLSTSIFAILQMLLPLPVLILFSGLLCIYCILQDKTFGIPYAMIYGIGTYYQAFVLSSLTIQQAFIGILFASVVQLGLGHAIFERRLPNETEGIRKSNGIVFAVLDVANELLPATFHFYSMLLLELGFRKSFNRNVLTELAMQKEKIQQLTVLQRKSHSQ